ncbi:gonadotropin subunit beta-1-like [Syngnathoides biaculeatus]|uniref:gonadotropin subunit beta-1-like n=1 Tax=Syngnathoides biaculeatus TaxID=300417 RepID=UPI002ADDAFFB|nr:gonadotropin subunit beta-1-like [Syngnathoides biaculeatus]
MQLVVMVTVLALVGVSNSCSFGCSQQGVSIPVESCGKIEYVNTTVCEGHCYNKDPVYYSPVHRNKQYVCNGVWIYENKLIEGCSVGVTYPVAKNCTCTSCNGDDTYCGLFPGSC